MHFGSGDGILQILFDMIEPTKGGDGILEMSCSCDIMHLRTAEKSWVPTKLASGFSELLLLHLLVGTSACLTCRCLSVASHLSAPSDL